jgi:UDP-N-acetylmuramoyl-tripeptide--D-alanyl-D-alanine ligase
MELTVAEIADATAGTVVAGPPTAAATSFTIDSRHLAPGACFVALVAARDGHDYVPDAWARGAAVALVSRPVDSEPPPGAALVLDGDGFDALAGLGRRARAALATSRVVAVTGSAGKTATKDLTLAAVAGHRRAHASPGSFNNEAGVPLTLLSAPPDTEVVVTEMGAREPGNIEHLAAIARPDIGIVTHVGLAHAGHLGGPTGVAEVKGELVAALPPTGRAILNHDCPFADRLAARSAAPVLRVGEGAGADVRVADLHVDDELHPRFTLETPWGTAPVRLALHGAHHATNAAMAATAAVELGVPLDAAAAGLARARGAALRMQIERTAGGVTLINDAYNSSPTSAAAALRALGRLPVPGRRIAVLGEMLELGPYGRDAHATLGTLAVEVGVDLLVTVGTGADVHAAAAAARAGGLRVVEATDPAAAASAVRGEASAGDAVLVKASRLVGLEQVAAALQPREAEPA